MFHTLPFLVANYHVAIVVAIIVVGLELLLLAWLRYVFFETGFLRSLIFIAGGGALIAALSAAPGGRRQRRLNGLTFAYLSGTGLAGCSHASDGQ